MIFIGGHRQPGRYVATAHGKTVFDLIFFTFKMFVKCLPFPSLASVCGPRVCVIWSVCCLQDSERGVEGEDFKRFLKFRRLKKQR